MIPVLLIAYSLVGFSLLGIEMPVAGVDPRL